jgi:F0F1-type ATP synthase epsilon subunit
VLLHIKRHDFDPRHLEMEAGRVHIIADFAERLLDSDVAGIDDRKTPGGQEQQKSDQEDDADLQRTADRQLSFRE